MNGNADWLIGSRRGVVERNSKPRRRATAGAGFGRIGRAAFPAAFKHA